MALQSASHLPAGGPAPRGITNWTAIVMFPKQIPCPRPRSHPALDLSLLERLPSFTAILSCPCCTQRFSTEQYHLLSLSEIPHHFQDHTPHSVLQQNSGLFGFFFFFFWICLFNCFSSLGIGMGRQKSDSFHQPQLEVKTFKILYFFYHRKYSIF